MTLAEHPQRISDLMRQLKDTAAHEESVSVGHILQVFGVRGFAFLLLMLALLNIVIFMVPLISVLFGLPMVVLTAQMVLGFRAPVFPRIVRRRNIGRGPLLDGLNRAIFGVEKVEKFIKPRLMFMTHPYMYRVHGLIALIMAVMVTLPIPVFNVPPSVGIAFLAIGMLERDGAFILLGYAVGLWCLWLFQSLSHFAHSLTG